MQQEGLICEVGCGKIQTSSNLIAIGIRKMCAITILANTLRLPFRDEYFTLVNSNYIIEHYSHKDVESLFFGLIRIVQPSGSLKLRRPDLHVKALTFFLMPDWKSKIDFNGEQEYQDYFTISVYSCGAMKKLLERAGLLHSMKIYNDFLRNIFSIIRFAIGVREENV